MKKYFVPEIEITLISKTDILEGSDTIIPIGGLYGEEVAFTPDAFVSEYTGEPIEE